MWWLLLALVGCGLSGPVSEPPPAPTPIEEEVVAVPSPAPVAAPVPVPVESPAGALSAAEPTPTVTPPPVATPVVRAASPTPPAAVSPTPAASTPAPVVPPPVATPAPRGPTTYQLQARASWVYVLIRYDRDTLIAGHDHAARATELSGTVVWDPTGATPCRVEVVVPVRGLKVDSPGLRTRAGLEGDTPAGDLPKIEKNMLSSDQLDADRFPEIRFRATSCAGTSGKVVVEGELTLRGVTKAVKTTMTVKEDGAAFSASGVLKIRHTTFGFKPFSAALGALKNEDELKLVLELVGAP